MDMNLILTSIGVFLGIILVLVAILLTAKAYLSPSGNVTITINDKDTVSRKASSFPRPVAVRVRADSANCKFLRAVATYSTRRRATSPASRSRTIGVWVASAK